MNCIVCPQTQIRTFLRLGFFFFGTTPPFSSVSSSPPVFRFLRAPFLRDLVLLLVAVLVAPEVFFTVILVADDLTVNLVLLGTGMIFTLDGPAAVALAVAAAVAVPVGEGLGLTVVGLTAGVDVDVETTGAVAVAPLSVAVAVLVAVLVGVPVVPSGFSDGIFSPVAVLVVDGIIPPAMEAALGGEVVVATTLSVVVSISTVVSAIAVEVDEVLVTPALVGLSFLMEVVTAAAAAVTSVDSVSSLGGTEDATGITDVSSLVSAAASVVVLLVVVILVLVLVLVVVVKLVNSPGSTSLFSLLPFVSTSIFVDGSVVSIIVFVR